jgi:hypothetical protein
MAASTDWVSYYRANQADGGTIEALYAFDDEELAEISKSHNDDAGKLRATIAGSGDGNIVLVPGPKGFAISSIRDLRLPVGVRAGPLKPSHACRHARKSPP